MYEIWGQFFICQKYQYSSLGKAFGQKIRFMALTTFSRWKIIATSVLNSVLHRQRSRLNLSK